MLQLRAGQVAEAGELAGPLSHSATALRDELLTALGTELDTRAALEVLWRMLRADLPATERRALLIEIDGLLGFGLTAYARPPAEALPPEALRLIEQRDAARRERQWARSDELRAELLTLGVESQDSRDGSVYLRIV